MPSRRTRRRRGHHHPTRHARWRRSIDQPPGQAPGPVTRPTKLRTKLRGGHRPTTPGAPNQGQHHPGSAPAAYTGTYAPIAERRTGTRAPYRYVRTDRRAPYWHTRTDRRAGFASSRRRSRSAQGSTLGNLGLISASSRLISASSRPHLGLISPHLGHSEARLRLRALDLEQLIGHRGELLRLVECL